MAGPPGECQIVMAMITVITAPTITASQALTRAITPPGRH
jgi:hypothetical protein